MTTTDRAPGAHTLRMSGVLDRWSPEQQRLMCSVLNKFMADGTPGADATTLPYYTVPACRAALVRAVNSKLLLPHALEAVLRLHKDLEATP